SAAALYVANANGHVIGTITGNQFNNSNIGAEFYSVGPGVSEPVLSSNTFYSNTYGLYTDQFVQFINGVPQILGGISTPHLNSNTFNIHRAYPIYLHGAGYPTYSGNSFSNSHFRAIGLSGYFSGAGGTWPNVVGDSGQVFPYVVDGDVWNWD